MKEYDVIIVGGGASGVTCAINLRRYDPNLSVLILEAKDRVLKKVLKTGNGKCNLGNTYISEDHYYNYELFSKLANEFDVRSYYKDLGLVTKVDSNGRIYPYSEVANSVVSLLLNELDKKQIDVVTSYTVNKVSKNNGFVINNEYKSKYLVIATGSIAQTNTSGYDLAKAMGHNITKLQPVLTPIKVSEETKSLSGIKVKCKLTVNDFSRVGEILFKDDGISGILALEASRYVKSGDKIYLDFAYDIDDSELKDYLKYDSDIRLNGLLPKMLVKKIGNNYDLIKNYPLTVKGLYDYDYAQVVRGGVDIKELKDTFESKIKNNLYFCGEVIDVDGDCGGYNLYFAWLSGYYCAKNIVKSI